MPEISATVTAPGTTTASHVQLRGHSLAVDRPEAKGGTDAGPMGGELLLAALGGCFTSTLIAAAGGRDIPLRDIVVTVTGELQTAPQRFGAITMTVTATGCDHDTLAHLLQVAERGCIVANTLRNDIALSVGTLRVAS